MAEQQANVTSIDAIDSFRGRLVIFMENAHRALDEVDRELRVTKAWIDGEALSRWRMEKKKRERKLEMAEQELVSARLSVLKESETVQQMAVRRARRAVDEADAKLKVIKRWSREYDHAVYPLARHLQALRHHLNKKLPISVAKLVEIVKTLDAYSELGRAVPSAPPSSSTDEENQDPIQPQTSDSPSEE